MTDNQRLRNRVLCLLLCIAILMSMLPLSILTATAASSNAVNRITDRQQWMIGQSCFQFPGKSQPKMQAVFGWINPYSPMHLIFPEPELIPVEQIVF